MNQTEHGTRAAVCDQCPWRVANQGRRTRQGIYTKANLTRLWNQVRRGGAVQSCHLTDPTHRDHIALGANPERQKPPEECLGAVILVCRELEHIKTLSTDTTDADELTVLGVQTYWRDRARRGLTQSGILFHTLLRHLPRPVGSGRNPLPSPGGILGDPAIGRLGGPPIQSEEST